MLFLSFKYIIFARLILEKLSHCLTVKLTCDDTEVTIKANFRFWFQKKDSKADLIITCFSMRWR